MPNLLQSANFNIECDCKKLWANEVFDDVLADRHRTRCYFKTWVTYGCLKQILTWSHSNMLAIKWFTAKKSVGLNDDEPRPIPKDSAHLMIRKVDEAYIAFIQSRSNANAYVDLLEYTLKSKLSQVQHLTRTLRGVLFQSVSPYFSFYPGLYCCI